MTSLKIKSMAALVLSLALAAPAMAKRAPVTIQVVGTTSAKIMVNGKEYVPGTPLPRHAKITVNGPATLVIGGVTVTTQGGDTALQLSGNSISVVTGSVSVTTAGGQTQSLNAGQKVSVAPAAQTPAAASSPDSTPAGVTPPPPPPPNPQQNKQVVSPSAP